MSGFFYMCLRIDRGGPEFVRLVRADHVIAVLSFCKAQTCFSVVGLLGGSPESSQ